jgi:dolichyl-phosphate beta-glucosyltransferase
MTKKVSIIIPNFNEAGNVRRGVLGDVISYLRKQTYTWEVIISDDGSTDESLALIEKFAAKNKNMRVIKNKHAGKPFALRSGIGAAEGQYVLLTDMDQSTPITELGKLLPYTDKGFKVVIGSRGARRTDSSLFRQFASIVFLVARGIILLPEIRDTQCGFKLLETSLARKIFDRMRILGRDHKAKGWKVTAYDVEMLHIAKKLGEKIKEVRVIWKNEDTSSGKSRNFIKESLEMFLEVLRVRVNDTLGKYD